MDDIDKKVDIDNNNNIDKDADNDDENNIKNKGYTDSIYIYNDDDDVIAAIIQSQYSMTVYSLLA